MEAALPNLLSTPNFEIYYLSEQAVTISFGNEISESLAQEIRKFNSLIHQNPFAGFNTTVPAYATLTVFYDPLVVLLTDLEGLTCFDKISSYLHNLKTLKENRSISKEETITIPVYYGGDFGPDLDEISLHTKLGHDEIINIHSSVTYKVYMIGFVPGFPYLGGMDKRLTTPRKTYPRAIVPAGAVGIAGEQTGVYPLETPGGWQIIGRTPTVLFNPKREQPSLLKAGNQVIFKPIGLEEFEHLSGK